MCRCASSETTTSHNALGPTANALRWLAATGHAVHGSARSLDAWHGKATKSSISRCRGTVGVLASQSAVGFKHQGNRFLEVRAGFFEGCALRVRAREFLDEPHVLPRNRAKDGGDKAGRIEESDVLPYEFPEAAGTEDWERCGLGDVQEIAVPGDQHIRPTCDR